MTQCPSRLLVSALVTFLHHTFINACNRKTAVVETPPKDYIYEHLYKNIECRSPADFIECLHGGVCQMYVKWSVRDSTVVEKLSESKCICQTGFTGYRCELIDFFPSTFSINTASMLSFFLFLALIMVILIIFVYLCCIKYCWKSESRRSKNKRHRHWSKTSTVCTKASLVSHHNGENSYMEYLCSKICQVNEAADFTDNGHDHRHTLAVHSTPLLSQIRTPAKQSMGRVGWGQQAFNPTDGDITMIDIDDEFDLITDPTEDSFHSSALIGNNATRKSEKLVENHQIVTIATISR